MTNVHIYLVNDEKIVIFPKESGPPLSEIITQTMTKKLPSGRASPNPADMQDARIVDYTLNKRLFPVPLFPAHQNQESDDSTRYARISVPV